MLVGEQAEINQEVGRHFQLFDPTTALCFPEPGSHRALQRADKQHSSVHLPALAQEPSGERRAPPALEQQGGGWDIASISLWHLPAGLLCQALGEEGWHSDIPLTTSSISNSICTARAKRQPLEKLPLFNSASLEGDKKKAALLVKQETGIIKVPATPIAAGFRH